MIYPPGIKPGLSALKVRLMLVSHFSFNEKYFAKLEFRKGLGDLIWTRLKGLRHGDLADFCPNYPKISGRQLNPCTSIITFDICKKM